MELENMLSSQQPPTKEIDVAFLVFIERYATDLLKWDILTFFANNPEFCISASTLAKHIGRSVHSVRPELSEVDRLLGSNKKIKHLTNWEPQYSLEEGLNKTIEWFSNPDNRRAYKTDVYNI